MLHQYTVLAKDRAIHQAYGALSALLYSMPLSLKRMEQLSAIAANSAGLSFNRKSLRNQKIEVLAIALSCLCGDK